MGSIVPAVKERPRYSGRLTKVKSVPTRARVPDTDGHGAEGLDKVWPSARRHPAVVGDNLAPGIETHTLGDPAVADNGQWLRQLSQEVELAMVRTVAAFAFPHAQVNR